MSQKENLIKLWSSFELLSPDTIDFDEIKAIKIEEDELPWLSGLKPKEGYKLEYHLFFGIIYQQDLNNFLIKLFDDEETKQAYIGEKERYITANMTIDQYGFYKKDSFAISSMPFAVKQLHNDLSDDGETWKSIFDSKVENIKRKLEYVFNKLKTTEESEHDGVDQHISFNDLNELKIELIKNFQVAGLMSDEIFYYAKQTKADKKPDFAGQYINNSRFAEDLSKVNKAIDKHGIPKALNDYLDAALTEKPLGEDVLKNADLVREKMQLDQFPRGAWPSPHKLSLMQQFAVNTIHEKFSNKNARGIYAVNGPPGTGKTTLLRDIIAFNLVERAIKMISYEDPKDAFTRAGKIKVSDSFRPAYFSIDQKLNHYGMVIASSNNGAVENISKELPLIEEVKPYEKEIEYFKQVAQISQDENYWGLLSAPLGNRNNVNKYFKNVFPTNKKDGPQPNLNSYLAENKLATNEEWNKVKKDFQLKIEEHQSEILRLQKLQSISNQLLNTRINVANLEKDPNMQDELERQKDYLDSLEQQYEQIQLEENELIQEEEIWKNIDEDENQLISPFYSDKLKQLNAELFIQAMKVSEIFICRANNFSGCIGTSLIGFVSVLDGKAEADKEELQDLWNMFMLVSPVISTTFASFGNIFKDLGAENLPWLIIDEAGQVPPQAALGAIWRSKRAVVVGDPLQIEPVVTLHDLLAKYLPRYYKIKEELASKEISVQMNADKSNKYGAYVGDDEHKTWLGTPLLVHRRTAEPMFSMANNLVYDGNMVLATREKKLNSKLPQNGFIHVEAKVNGKHYVPRQMEIIADLLAVEYKHLSVLPDLFIISPFKEVEKKLKADLVKEIPLVLDNLDSAIDKSQLRKWLNKSIGTIHKFQGRAASSVILCLGLDSSKIGSANGIARRPNILNVALTRTKYQFLAIGDRNLWAKVDYYSKLTELDQYDEESIIEYLQDEDNNQLQINQ